MNKETKIAKENLMLTPKMDLVLEEHKNTCQRWLDENEDDIINWTIIMERCKDKVIIEGIRLNLNRKIKEKRDKEQTIKLYNNVGI